MSSENEMFLPPKDFIPFVQQPGWILFAGLTTQARAVVDFLFGHVNPATGDFLAIPSMPSIAEYLGAKSVNTARTYVNELKRHGMVASVRTYWDQQAKRRTTQPVRDDGVKNEQDTNTFQLRWFPADGRMHQGPLNADEWHNPHKIGQRIAAELAREQAEQPTPPQHTEGGVTQGKRTSSQVTPPLNVLRGAPSTHRGGPPQHIEDEGEPPKENQPTNQAADEASPPAPEANDGWLGTEHEETNTEQDVAESAGARLLRELPLPQGAAPLNARAVATWGPVVDRASAAGHSPVALIQRLTSGLTDARNPAGVVHSRLADLAAELDRPAGGTSRPEAPDWCGACGGHYPDARAQKNPKWRLVLDPDGETEQRCPRCHPKSQPVAA